MKIRKGLSFILIAVFLPGAISAGSDFKKILRFIKVPPMFSSTLKAPVGADKNHTKGIAHEFYRILHIKLSTKLAN